jgi:hypothetical protein
MLVALAWSSLAFCGEIHDAAAAGDLDAKSDVSLPDGTKLRLENVSYGIRDTNFVPLELVDTTNSKVRTVGYSGWSLHTNMTGLNFWFTRRDTQGNLLDVNNIRDAEILDSHGDVYFVSMVGRSSIANPVLPVGISTVRFPQGNLGWLTFEGAPLHEKRFRLRLGGPNGEYLGEYTIDNPVSAPQDVIWPIRPLPATNIEGDLTFALTKVSFTNSISIIKQPSNTVSSAGSIGPVPRMSDPTFEVREYGVISEEWQPAHVEGWDSSGNYATKRFDATKRYAVPSSLDPGAKAWKFVISFYGTEHARLASNNVAVFTNIAVPQPGELLHVDRSLSVPGMGFQLLALCGPGEVSYLNKTPIGVAKSTDLTPGYNRDFNPAQAGEINERVRSTGLQLAVRIWNATTDDARLTIRAVDDRGREFYAGYGLVSPSSKLPNSKEVNYLQAGSQFPIDYSLELAPDSKTIDLYFCLHHPRIEEFIVPPPIP